MSDFSPNKQANGTMPSPGSTASDENFARFAHKHFAGGIPAEFTRKDLRHAVLNYTPDSQKRASIAIFKMILRFMGDVADYRSNLESSHQPNMGSVMSRLYERLGIATVERDQRSKTDTTTEDDDNAEAVLALQQSLFKKKGGTLRRLKATITHRFFKDREHTVFNFLPIEETLRTPLEQLHFIVGYGIIVPDLRDEIYCQICKQLSNNTFKTSIARGWLLLTLTAGCFAPSEYVRGYILRFLDDGPPMYSINCKKILQRTLYNGTRFQPPAYIELESGLQKKLQDMSVTFMDGTMHTEVVDSATTARELCVTLADVIDLKERFGFSLYISIFNKVASLGNGRDHVLDSISQCEQIYYEQEGKIGPAPWRLFFRKEMFSPWESAASDEVATNLTFAQVVRGIMLGEYSVEQDQTLAVLAAQQYYIEYGADISEEGLTALLPSYIPPDKCTDEDTVLLWRKAVIRAHQKLFSTKDYTRLPSTEKVKQEIVHFAKTKWFMAFSRYYDVTKLEGPDWPAGDLSIAVNWTGVYVLTSGEILFEMSYPEILKVNDGGSKSKTSNVAMFLLVTGGALKFSSHDADDLRYIVGYMMDGLRERSTFAVAVQTHQGDSNKELNIIEGDLLILSKPLGKEMGTAECTAKNERTNETGKVLKENFYLLPTLVTPNGDILSLFKTANLNGTSE